jgi:G:T/U-mismatch repair DNA glycosylase
MQPNLNMEIHPFNTRWREFNWDGLDPQRREAWVVNQQAGYFGFLPNKTIQHLIIGSFPIGESVHHDPPHGNRFDFSFFYCSNVNGFYKILKPITGYDFLPHGNAQNPVQKVICITDFFLQREIGITDILYEVIREGGADDKGLTPVEFNNVCKLLKEYKNIKCVYFTSKGVRRWFLEQLRKCSKQGQIRGHSYQRTFGRDIQLYDLFSPSPNANVPAQRKLNSDQIQHGDRSMGNLMSLIPFMQEEGDQTIQYRMCQWANGLDQVPDLIRPEITNSPEFQEIRVRF